MLDPLTSPSVSPFYTTRSGQLSLALDLDLKSKFILVNNRVIIINNFWK